jgi:hypothetical protein
MVYGISVAIISESILKSVVTALTSFGIIIEEEVH